MNTRAAMLETIPNELILLVLSSCDSTRSLHSLIVASPRCHRVFADSPESILLPLLRRAVSSEIWGDFAAVCSADAFTQPDSRDPIAKAEEIGLFLDRYFGGGVEMPTDKASIVAGFRLLTITSDFVNDYVKQAMEEISFLAEHGSYGSACSILPNRMVQSSSPDSGRLLPPGGPARFFRGLLRLELQSRIFRHEQRVFTARPGRNLFGSEQFDLYLRRMQPWAVEELTCAHNHLMHRTWDALQKSSRLSTPHDTIAWPVYVSGELLLRGMDFLYDVLAIQNPGRVARQRQLLDEEAGAAASGGLKAGSPIPEFLVGGLESAQFHELVSMPEPSADETDSDRPSWGFYEHVQRARIAGRYLPIMQAQAHAAVRAMGYVFWDAAKMKSDVMRNAMAGVTNMSTEEYHDRYDRQHRRIWSDGRNMAVIAARDQGTAAAFKAKGDCIIDRQLWWSWSCGARLVAGPRKGHAEAGLDLCYVTDHIIATYVTSSPAQSLPPLVLQRHQQSHPLTLQ
ncbi:hypothetical protein NLG97_g6084 [Lecanicillium saksenae]|uniref:Uncharacterized protein n=1 Tax=Lecanicillium saksenae TaxID=468837 RepID=A0ACC1QSA1_9HYPO|nr:hypothetical protein NLG97_g6084 [Lecanicillium saksenae]